MNYSFFFKGLEINDHLDGLEVTINGTNSMYLKQSYYALPTTTNTFSFPIGTIIHKVTCSIENIISTPVAKEPRLTPKMISSDKKTRATAK